MNAQPQTSIYEKLVEDPELESLLEKRQTAKEQAAAVRKKYTDADVAAKESLGWLELGIDAVVRVGRFAITMRKTAPKSVSFETAAGERLAIRLLDDEA